MNKLIIQPNQLTNARYDFTAIQKNIIYKIIGDIQNFMNKEKQLNLDIFSDYVISVKINELSKNNKITNYRHIIDSAKDLMKKPLEYKTDNEVIVTTIINTARHTYGSETVELTISKHAIPVLLYIGKGFTQLQKTIAIGLKSVYSKRMYEFCNRWKDRGGYQVSLIEFKKQLKIENKKTYNQISNLRSKILNVAQKELKESADVWFEYSFSKIDSKSYNLITFKIYQNNFSKENSGEKAENYAFIYNFLNLTYPNYKSDKAQVITDFIANKGRLKQATKRFSELNDDFQKQKKSIIDIKNLTKTILRKDYQYPNV